MLDWRLILVLARNDLRARYRGAVIGQLWLVLTPLVSLFLYSVVFSTIFQARWQFMGTEVYTNYTIVLFPGLMMYQLMMEVLQKGANAVEVFSGVTSKISIRLIDLMLGMLLASFIPFWITIGLWYLLVGIFFNFSFLGLLAVLVSMALFSLFCAGVSFLSAVIGGLLRDWLQIVGMVSMGFLFLSPILYPIDHLPEQFRQVIYLNPLSHYVDIMRIGAFQPILEPLELIAHLATLSALSGITVVVGLWLQHSYVRFVNA